MIMAFSDGETEARKMISLGTKLTLEVRSVASEQGLQWMGVMVMPVCVWRERERSSFCLGSEEPAGTGVAVLEEEDIPSTLRSLSHPPPWPSEEMPGP